MKRVKFFLFLLPAISFLFLLPQSASAETKTVIVAQDAYANEAYPDKIYGSLNHIVTSNKFTTRLGYIQFEYFELPDGAVIDSGTLRFNVYERHYADTGKVNVGPITGDWNENAVTWNSKPTINQTQAIEAQVDLTSDGWKEVAITSLVRKWSDGTIEQKGLFIYPYGFLYATPETEYAFTFRTKESDSAPKLEIEYHLEPSPSPSPAPSPTPADEEEEEADEEIVDEEEISPEESPSPSPEAEEGKILGIFKPGQALIAGLTLLAIIGAGISFAAYARRKPKKKPKEKPPAKEEEPEESEPKV